MMMMLYVTLRRESKIMNVQPPALSAPASRDNLIFRVTPELTVYDGTTQTLELSSLRSTLAYADPAQFSCYSLRGSTFVRTTPSVFLKPEAGPSLGLFCV
jgi:hypothetical protein